jgi:hypothetical protein
MNLEQSNQKLGHIHILWPIHQNNYYVISQHQNKNNISNSKQYSAMLEIKRQITDTYTLSGVYEMTRKDCPTKYAGQTGRTFRARYNEHMREIKTNGKTSKYAQHIHDTMHN